MPVVVKAMWILGVNDKNNVVFSIKPWPHGGKLHHGRDRWFGLQFAKMQCLISAGVPCLRQWGSGVKSELSLFTSPCMAAAVVYVAASLSEELLG